MNNSSHPKGLYLIFATSTAERFSYFGMRAIFILYLTQALLMDTQTATSIYGSYTGLVYLAPLLGGYIADRYWGIRKSITWGIVMMSIGQFLMFASASVYEQHDLSRILMYGGLALLIMGNGTFKPTTSAVVGKLYRPNDSRLDSAYTIYYMGVNIGAFIAPLACGFFGETGNPADFKWGFLIAAVVTILLFFIFQTQKSKYLIGPNGEAIGVIPDAKQKSNEATQQQTEVELTPEERAAKQKKQRSDYLKLGLLTAALIALFSYLFDDWVSVGIFTACIICPVSIMMDDKLSKIERDRIWVIYIIAFFVIFFWAAYEQAGASLNIFAAQQTDRVFFGWEMPASWTQSFNAIFVVIMAALAPYVWSYLHQRNMEPSAPTKQAIGLLLLSLGYLFICIGVQGVEPGVKVSIIWITGLYFIHTLGEISLSPIGLSMVNKLTPVRFASLMMGIWFMSTASANKFAGMLGGLYPEDGKVKHLLGFEISTLFDFFMIFVVMSAVASLILFLLSKKLQRMMHGVE